MEFFDNSSLLNASDAFDLNPYQLANFALWNSTWVYVVFGITAIAAVLINILVIITYASNYTLRNPIDRCITSLACIDFLSGAIGIPILFVIYSGGEWLLF